MGIVPPESRMRMPTPKPLLVALIASLAVLAIPAAAQAKEPCWKELVNDYWADFRVDKVYPITCYRDAMEALPDDVSQYSDAQDDLRRALLDAIRGQRADGVFVPPSDEDDEPAAGAAGSGDDGCKGFFCEVIERIGPKNADSVPVPMLILGGIAVLLLGAAGTSYAARWFQARRMQIATHPAPPDKRP